MLVSAHVIDEIERVPWRRPPLVQAGGPSGPDGGYHDELEEAVPEPGSADEVRQLVACRVVLLHSERPTDREAMIVLAEQHGLAWLLDRWMPGLLSDWKRVGPRIVRLAEVIDVLRAPPHRHPQCNPSMRMQLRRELMEIDRRLVGLTFLPDRPSLLVCGTEAAASSAVLEAERSGVSWLAPDSDGGDLRFMRCVADCVTTAREDGWDRARVSGTLADPMIPQPAVIPLDPATWLPTSVLESGGGEDIDANETGRAD